jgi:cytochrome P450
MSRTNTAPQAPEVPSHVPPELVRNVNLFNDPAIETDPYAFVAKLHDGPRTIFNVGIPMREPAWTPTRAEDIRAILQDPANFSSEGVVGFSRLIGESWSTIPSETDPPAHGAYRALLNPLMSPKRIAEMEDAVRERAVQLVDALKGQTSTEFMKTFGRAFPVYIFLQLMGLPTERVEQFYGWMHDVLHGQDMAERSRAMSEVASYLRGVAKERAGKPADDLVSTVVNARIEGRALNDDEVIGMLVLIFGGGIDTVANMLGFCFLHLARDPALQAHLAAHPSEIPSAVEEFLRRYTIVMPYRKVVNDIEAAGVQMKAGDWVHCLLPAADIDPAEFENPSRFDPERSANRHIAFSTGPHRCVGSHLARREMAIALEEWLTRMPRFRLADGEAYHCHGGLFGVDHLNLVWD